MGPGPGGSVWRVRSCPGMTPPPPRVNLQLHKPQALCICPTRELVQQNLSVLQRMGKFTGIQVRAGGGQGVGGRARGAGKLKGWVGRVCD